MSRYDTFIRNGSVRYDADCPPDCSLPRFSLVEKRIPKTSATFPAGSVLPSERCVRIGVEFVVEHPGVSRILFGELQHAEQTTPKRMAQTLIQHYGERLQRLVEKDKSCGDLDARLDTEASAMLFISIIQGLGMQSLLDSDLGRIRRDAPRVFAIYRRGIRCAQ